MTTHGTRSPAEIRRRVSELQHSHTIYEIADLVGISSQRVQRVLDQLDDEAAGVLRAYTGLTDDDQKRPRLGARQAEPAIKPPPAPKTPPRPRGALPREHGSLRGYNQHRNRRPAEKPCAACRLAWNTYQNERNRRKREEAAR